MAATELIHFPLWAQPSPRHWLPAQTLFEPASLIRFNLPAFTVARLMAPNARAAYR